MCVFLSSVSLYHVVLFLCPVQWPFDCQILSCSVIWMEWIAPLLGFSHQIFLKPWDLPSFPLSQYMNQNESVSVEGEGEERRVEQKKKIFFQKRCCFLRGQT